MRQQSTGDVLTFNYRWWTALYAAAPLVFAGMIFSRHPTTWVNGVWRPWWKFRGWYYLDVIRAVGALVLAVMSPLMLCNRLELGPNYLQESNWLGLRATRRIEFGDLDRIDVKSAEPAGKWAPDKNRQHSKKPDMVAVRKDGSVEEFRGTLVSMAQPELLARARAAGVNVVTTDDPGAARAAPPPMAVPMQRPFGDPRRAPWGNR